MTKLPLEGVRVVDMTGVWAGTYGTRLLGDWGAEVIRVEPRRVFQPSTRGQQAHPSKALMVRSQAPTMAAPDWEPGERPWNRMPIFNSHARNKLSMTVDLTKPEGKDIFRRLIAVSDIFVENTVPETLERLGVDYPDLVKVRPDLIMVRMPAYGLSGPYKNYRSFGAQLECVVGHTYLRGDPSVDPTQRGDVFTADGAAGVGAALAAVLALRHRKRTGKGQLVELAQAENFIPYLGQALMDYTMNGRVQDTIGNRHPDMAPHGCYPCRGDDRWVTIAVRSDEDFAALSDAMGRPELARDPRYATAASRLQRQDELDAIVSGWTSARDPWDVFQTLQARGIPAGPVMNEADAFADPHLQSREYFQPLTQQDTGTHLYPGPMWRQSKTPNRLRLPPCRLGEHNAYVYQELLGLGREEYARLEQAGHIGMDYLPGVT